MEVDVEDLDPSILKKATFFNAHTLDCGVAVFVADYGESKVPYRWVVIDTSTMDCKITIYTTEEMRYLYKSFRDPKGKPISVPKSLVYRYLVQAGVYKIKIKEGCTGCGKFWDTTQGLWRCWQCNRCQKCCHKSDVRASCAARSAARWRRN